MKFNFSILIAFISISFLGFSQTSTVSGTITDATSNETMVGALVQFSPIFKSKTDLDGNYSIKDLPYGTYTVVISMPTYDNDTLSVTIAKENETLDFQLGAIEAFNEVEVIANIAIDRKTPVAVTTMDKQEIMEELGSRELPMVLNSKPGVYATQQGGGDGDARITIRGFDQRNVGVMIDGVPVNDMENGWVYWSNWFGLDQITSQIQVQRGLGATKLAMPSVGGTMNIITDNAFGKKHIKFQQEYGSGNLLRSSFSYTSGALKNGWAVVLSGSYKQGQGWVDGLSTLGGFYYLKVQKKIKRHILSLSAFGAPQQHGQRTFNQAISYWDSDYAAKLGIDTVGAFNNGLRFNQHYGMETDADGNQKLKNERLNYFHKPQVTLRDFWQVNEKLTWTNTAYVSVGRGGGTQARNSGGLIFTADGTLDWDQMKYNNQNFVFFGDTSLNIDNTYSATELKSSQVIGASVNNHIWVGGVSQIDFQINKNWRFAAGLDYRWYKGTHYTEVYDILGGDYYVSTQNQNSTSPMVRQGDKFGWQPYHNHRDALMQWAGGFAQVEYTNDKWSAFVNLSMVGNSYKGIDYFQKKELHINDTVYLLGGMDAPIVVDGKTYSHSSPELQWNQTERLWRMGVTAKAGANYNINDHHNVFINLGYLDRTPLFSNVIDNNTNTLFEEIVNEKIIAAEVGYGYRSKKVSVDFNAYYTNWKNKPFPYGVAVPDPNDPTTFIRANVNGMDALHWGLEVDAAYYVTKKLKFEAMISYGDWTWQSAETVDVVGTKFTFDAKGVHVGDAAQSVYALSGRWEFIKNGYLGIKYTYFDRYYANFDPFSLTGGNSGRESWKAPGYGLLGVNAGYTLKFKNKSSMSFRAIVNNVLNTKYISDARNNGNGSAFDAASATVFFGLGTTFNASISYEF
ncbi:MAG: TonB-dependent receptor [Bacteroidota bacterium]